MKKYYLLVVILVGAIECREPGPSEFRDGSSGRGDGDQRRDTQEEQQRQREEARKRDEAKRPKKGRGLLSRLFRSKDNETSSQRDEGGDREEDPQNVLTAEELTRAAREKRSEDADFALEQLVPSVPREVTVADVREQMNGLRDAMQRIMTETGPDQALMERQMAELEQASTRFEKRGKDKAKAALERAADEAERVKEIAKDTPKTELGVKDGATRGTIEISNRERKTIVKKTSLGFVGKVFAKIVHCYRRFKLERAMFRIQRDDLIKLAEDVKAKLQEQGRNIAWKSGNPQSQEATEARTFIIKQKETAADLDWEQYVSPARR